MAQERDLKPITIYLPEDLIVSLKRQALKSHDSVSSIIRRELLRPRVAGGDQAK